MLIYGGITNPAEREPRSNPAEREPRSNPAEREPRSNPAEREPRSNPAERDVYRCREKLLKNYCKNYSCFAWK